MQVPVRCAPVNGQPVEAWLNDVISVQAIVSWHVVQFAAAKAAPAVECVGLLVVCHVVRWQPEFPQSVGAIVSAELLMMWHCAQPVTLPAGAIWCEFVSGKPVVL